MAISCHVAVPFGRDEDGGLVPLEPVEAQSRESAERRAATLAVKPAGAIVLSRTGNPDTGAFGDTTIIATFGEVDHRMLGERYSVRSHFKQKIMLSSLSYV